MICFRYDKLWIRPGPTLFNVWRALADVKLLRFFPHFSTKIDIGLLKDRRQVTSAIFPTLFWRHPVRRWCLGRCQRSKMSDVKRLFCVSVFWLFLCSWMVGTYLNLIVMLKAWDKWLCMSDVVHGLWMMDLVWSWHVI